MKEARLLQVVNNKRIALNLPIEKKIQFYKRIKELDMSPSQFVVYLLNEYDGNHLSVISKFRYNLIKRIKKGINKQYLFELKTLRDQLNIIIEKY